MRLKSLPVYRKLTKKAFRAFLKKNEYQSFNMGSMHGCAGTAFLRSLGATKFLVGTNTIYLKEDVFTNVYRTPKWFYKSYDRIPTATMTGKELLKYFV